MSNEFKVKNGLIVNLTVPVTGIVSGNLSNDPMSLVTENVVHGISGSVDQLRNTTINGHPLTGNVTVSASDVPVDASGFDQILFASDDDAQAVADRLNEHQHNVGTKVIGLVTDNGDGTVDVASSMAWLHDNPSMTGHISKYVIPAAASLALSADSVNYLLADYNGGTPQYTLTISPLVINGSSRVLVSNMYCEGAGTSADIHIIDVDFARGTANRIVDRLIQERRFVRVSGLGLSETSERIINIAAGTVYYGIRIVSTSVMNSNSDTCDMWYHVGGVWTKTTVTQYNNTQYDDGTDLQTLSNTNRYAVIWVYRFVENVKHMAITLGDDDYDLTDARNSQPPTPPVLLQRQAILVGRIIVQKSATTALQIDSAFITSFESSVIVNHNDLDGLQGGITGQYYHMTSAQVVETDSVYSTVLANSAQWNASSSGALSPELFRSYSAVISAYNHSQDLSITGKLNRTDFEAYSATIGGYIPLSGSSQINGSLVPSVSNASLGSLSNPWSDLFVSSGSVYIGSAELSLDPAGSLQVNGDKVAYYSDVTAIITANVGGFLTRGEFSDYSGSISIEQHAQDLEITGKLGRADFDSYSAGLTGTFAAKAHVHSATAIVSDNLDSARLPVSGDWMLSGNLSVNNLSGIVMQVNSVSGRIGVLTSNPLNLLHVYGQSSVPDEADNIPNYVQVDSVPNGDSGVSYAIDGVKKFDQYMYRDEGGDYFYIWGQESQFDLQTITKGGKCGWLQPTNLLNYHTSYVDSGSGALNDMDAGGLYASDIPYNTRFQVKIVVEATPDQFQFRRSYDNGLTWTAWSSNIDCSTTPVELENGVTVVFGATTGHNTYDSWDFIAFTVNPDASFSIHGMMFTEVLTTTDYTQTTPEFNDITYDASTTYTEGVVGLPIGDGDTNKGALYLGSYYKFNVCFFIVKTAAANANLVFEYYKDGDGWTQITGANNLNDQSLNMTQIGQAMWRASSLTDWVTHVPPGKEPDGYDLYWIRVRSSTVMTAAPVCAAIMAHGDRRFSVYAGHLDPFPCFYVKGGGRTFVKVPDGRGPTFNIENATVTDRNMRFSVEEESTVGISMRQGVDDDSHETKYQYGGINFNNTDVDSTFVNKFDKAFKFYKDAAVGNDLVLSLNSDGSISTGVSAYEILVTDDNDIPNKKYVDSLIGGMQIQGSWDADTNTPDITGTTQVGYAWIVSVSGNTDLDGITDWQVGQIAVKTFSGWSKVNPVPSIWGTIQGTLSAQIDLWNQLENRVTDSELNVWEGNAYISTVGTISAGTWQGTRINAAYLDTTLTTQGNTFNGANQLVQMTAAAKLPAVNGSLLTSLAWSNVVKTSASIADLAYRNASDITTDPANRFVSDSQLTYFSGKVDAETYVAGQHAQDLVITGKQSLGNYITGLSGDVSASGPGNAAATIASKAVTLAKIQDITGPVLLGRHTSTVGVTEEISGAMVKDMLSLNNVENTALSTWQGSSNIHTVGMLSGFTLATVSKTNTYGIGSTDVVVLCDTTSTAFTVTLPTAVGATGKVYVIKRINAGNNRLTVATTSSQTIDGSTTYNIDKQYVSIMVVSDGSNWHII